MFCFQNTEYKCQTNMYYQTNTAHTHTVHTCILIWNTLALNLLIYLVFIRPLSSHESLEVPSTCGLHAVYDPRKALCIWYTDVHLKGHLLLILYNSSVLANWNNCNLWSLRRPGSGGPCLIAKSIFGICFADKILDNVFLVRGSTTGRSLKSRCITEPLLEFRFTAPCMY